MTDAGVPGGGKPYADEDKVHLFLAYFGILSLIPFFMFKDKRSDPQKEFVYWHARQGLALAICVFVLCIVGVIPILGWIIACVGVLAFWVLVIMGWIKAFGGQKWPIPGVSKLAEMFN